MPKRNPSKYPEEIPPVSSASKRGRASRQKGKVGEREIASMLRRYGFASARRGVQYNGRGGADVVGLDGWHVEVKRTEKVNLHEAYRQAVSDAPPGDEPLVVTRRNGEPWFAFVPFAVLLALLAERRDRQLEAMLGGPLPPSPPLAPG